MQSIKHFTISWHFSKQAKNICVWLNWQFPEPLDRHNWNTVLPQNEIIFQNLYQDDNRVVLLGLSSDRNSLLWVFYCKIQNILLNYNSLTLHVYFHCLPLHYHTQTLWSWCTPPSGCDVDIGLLKLSLRSPVSDFSPTGRLCAQQMCWRPHHSLSLSLFVCIVGRSDPPG